MSTRRGRYGDPRRRRPLVGDLQRMVQPTGVSDPRRLGGDIAGPGGPRDVGAVLLDTTDAVLLDGVSVSVVERVVGDRAEGTPAAYLLLDGRINKRRDRVRVGVLMNTDGAAAIITELLALADRAGPGLLGDLAGRLVTLAREGNVDLGWVRAAVDLAIEQTEPRPGPGRAAGPGRDG